jgi:hypothetical protein
MRRLELTLSLLVWAVLVLASCAVDHGSAANEDASVFDSGGNPGTGGAAGSNAGGRGGTSGGSGGGSGIIGNQGGNGAAGTAVVDAAADGSGPPVDYRPPRPPWNPPFPVGMPGWQSSTTPICESRQGQAASVWADQRGVFNVLSNPCQTVGHDLPACTPETERVAGTTIQFNDGTGWRSIYESQSAPFLHLSGFPGGSLVLSDYSCGISFLDPQQGVATCTTSLDRDSFPDGLVFVVNAALAYAVDGPKILRWAGAWQTIATVSEPLAAVWADEETVVVAGYNQAVLRKSSDSNDFMPLPEAPIGDYLSIWSLGAGDVWLGNSAGQLVRYDGTSWHIISTGPPARNAITAMWGSGGQLYFQSQSQFGRWNGQSIELLLSLPPDDGGGIGIFFNGLWGRSPNEVFLAFTDTAFEQFSCGGHFMMWFDGTQFRLF